MGGQAQTISDARAKEIAKTYAIGTRIPDLSVFGRTGRVTRRFADWAYRYLAQATRVPAKSDLALYVQAVGVRDEVPGWDAL